MYPSSELECPVCFNEFDAAARLPRVLECQHTFCTSCLRRLAKPKQHQLSIVCPLCRALTCVSAHLTLTCTLLVDIDVWTHVREAYKHGRVPEEELLPPADVWVTKGAMEETRRGENIGDKTKRQLRKLFRFLRGY